MRVKSPIKITDIMDTLVTGNLTLTSIEFEDLPFFEALEGLGAFGAFGVLFLGTCISSL
jgi:hypothetical protein